MNEKLVTRLRERADTYEAIYQGNVMAFTQSGSSYAIATALREFATILEQEPVRTEHE